LAVGDLGTTVTRPFGLSRDERIRSPLHFKRVYDRRCSTSDPWLIVYGCANGLAQARLGMSVSRKWGHAIVRNRIRRLYREAFRLSKPQLPTGMDFVFIPRKVDALTLDVLLTTVPKLTREVAQRCLREAKST
jgi:ribonuclease P protein component